MAPDKSRISASLLPAGADWDDADLPQAAVLVLIFPARQSHTLLTLRAPDLRLHADQISFPGGRREDADRTPERTALRETFEEIGLPTTHVEVVGRLADTIAGSDILITPVVGWCHTEPVLTPNPREVASLLRVPLENALDLDAYREGSRSIEGITRPYLYLDHGPHHVWGATARILHDLARRLRDVRQP